MCECKGCDNFKAKKREPQVGDKVKLNSGKEAQLMGIPQYHPTTGDLNKRERAFIRMLASDDDKSWSCGLLAFFPIDDLTVID